VGGEARPPARPDPSPTCGTACPISWPGAICAAWPWQSSARSGGPPVVWMSAPTSSRPGSPRWSWPGARGSATLIAVNGAFAYHDAELALWGATSEESAASCLRPLRHGARDGALLAQAPKRRAARRRAREALGPTARGPAPEWKSESILGCGHRSWAPGHRARSPCTDIVHQHPEFSGAATGSERTRFPHPGRHLADLCAGGRRERRQRRRPPRSS